MTREQAGGMAILAETKQHQIEGALVLKLLRIKPGGCCRAMLGRNDMDVGSGNVDPFQPGCRRHPAVALRIILRQTAFVTKPDLPARPVLLLCGQGSIEYFRRAAAGQDEMENSPCGQRGIRSLIDPGDRSRQPVRSIDNMPAWSR